MRAVLRLAGLPADARQLTDTVMPWLRFGNLHVDFGFLLDPLSAVMILVVTGVGLLIHVYSLGYMSHDKGFARFFAYLNLFIFAMLCLVLGENLVVLFLGWEGVGLCSYLLISFWFNEDANATAGKKAFITNRVGDFGFLLGMFLLAATLLPHLARGEGVFSFATLAHHADLLAPIATAAALLLFLGATGKSAQIPLYIWLPDAMAGPTPVSALIHAATMVTAGVYMIARLNFLFVLSPVAMGVVAGVGIATALLAATIALAQNDIKKVLAYSTVSQLGYMVTACGVGAFTAGIFHVMTHAFFKALLFLGAGSVIHGMSNEQDMRIMGGLRRKMPITHATMLIATLAIAGVFPLAGFFSKDEILYEAFLGAHGGFPFVWLVGLPGGRPDRLLHDAADGPDVLRREPRQPRGEAPHPRVAGDDDRAAGHPGGALGGRRLDRLAGGTRRHQPLPRLAGAGVRARARGGAREHGGPRAWSGRWPWSRRWSP